VSPFPRNLKGYADIDQSWGVRPKNHIAPDEVSCGVFRVLLVTMEVAQEIKSA
jgi:hypothetical protein